MCLLRYTITYMNMCCAHRATSEPSAHKHKSNWPPSFPHPSEIPSPVPACSPRALKSSPQSSVSSQVGWDLTLQHSMASRVDSTVFQWIKSHESHEAQEGLTFSTLTSSPVFLSCTQCSLLSDSPGFFWGTLFLVFIRSLQ